MIAVDLEQLLPALAVETAEHGDHTALWDALAEAATFAQRDDEHLAAYYGEDSPNPIDPMHAREKAQRELDDALAPVLRLIHRISDRSKAVA